MKSLAFEHFTMTWLPIIGLALFLLSFGTVFLWVFCYNSKDFYEKMGHIPLNEDQL